MRRMTWRSEGGEGVNEGSVRRRELGRVPGDCREEAIGECEEEEGDRDGGGAAGAGGAASAAKCQAICLNKSAELRRRSLHCESEHGEQ